MDKTKINLLRDVILSFIDDSVILEKVTENLEHDQEFDKEKCVKEMIDIMNADLIIPQIKLYIFVKFIFHHFESIYLNSVFILFIVKIIENNITNSNGIIIVYYLAKVLLSMEISNSINLLHVYHDNKSELITMIILIYIKILIYYNYTNDCINTCEYCKKKINNNHKLLCHYCNVVYYCSKKCINSDKKKHIKFCSIYSSICNTNIKISYDKID